MRMPLSSLQLPQRVCADDRLELWRRDLEPRREMVEALAEMRQRPLLQGAFCQLAEVGFRARLEDQGIGDPAHAVGAGQDTHFGLPAEQRQARRRP